VCLHACIYLCMGVGLKYVQSVCTERHICIHVCEYVSMHVCIHVHLYACMRKIQVFCVLVNVCFLLFDMRVCQYVCIESTHVHDTEREREMESESEREE